MPKVLDLTGQVFTRLTAIKFVGHNKDGKRLWLCQCSCGNTKETTVYSLTAKQTQSCGCMQSENAKKQFDLIERKTHGLSKEPIYIVWKNMKSRCDDVNQPAYKNYGGRGISYCKEWESFENFYKDMGDVPEGLTLERINNEGNYEPSNCRWATNSEQIRNRRRSDSYMSRHEGVSWNNQLNKWKGTVGHEGKQHHVGYFIDENECYEVVRAFRDSLLANSM